MKRTISTLSILAATLGVALPATAAAAPPSPTADQALRCANLQALYQALDRDATAMERIGRKQDAKALRAHANAAKQAGIGNGCGWAMLPDVPTSRRPAGVDQPNVATIKP